jgi:hypothetical protein
MILGLDFGTSTTVFSSEYGVLLIGQETLIPSLALYNADEETWKFGRDALEAGIPGSIITNLKAAVTQKLDVLRTIDHNEIS